MTKWHTMAPTPNTWAYTAAGCLVVAALGGCGGSDETEPPTTGPSPTSIFVVPDSLNELAGEQFYDHPWPSDLRLENGTVRFTGLYNPLGRPIIADYIEAIEGLLDGFSPVAGGYLRFDRPLDTTSLPADPMAAMDPTSSVQLLDTEPSSPDYGSRRQVSLSFREADGAFLVTNTLRFMPSVGFPLRPHTRYALVVTNTLRATDGRGFGPSAHLQQVLGLAASTGAREQLSAQWSDALEEIEKLGISASDIVHLTVFTTGDPTAELLTFQQHLRSDVAAPDFVSGQWVLNHSDSEYDEYQGRYGQLPNYQYGTLPFTNYGDGGYFNYAGGQPAVVDYFDARFSLTVPNATVCPMPTNGYPISLYAHGTGGDYLTHLGSYHSGTAKRLARKCIASMGVDQIFHGERPGAPTDPAEIEMVFSNYNNIIAARTNGRQAALDEVQRARLFTETQAIVPASVSATGQAIKFDADKVLFFGHSQGGLNGPLYLAADDSARGGVLSGSGTYIGITLLETSVLDMVRTIFLGLSTEQYEELDLYHPTMMLAQSLIDPVDPISYARFTVLEPPNSHAPKSIYMTVGIAADGSGADSYAPPTGTEAQAITMGLPLQLPGTRPIEQLQWGGPEPVQIPTAGLCANLANGQASGVLAQWAPPAGNDGHYVVFDVPEAREQAAEFLRRLADDPKGCVPAP